MTSNGKQPGRMRNPPAPKMISCRENSNFASCSNFSCAIAVSLIRAKFSFMHSTVAVFLNGSGLHDNK